MTPRHSHEADGPERGRSAEVDATFEVLSAAERRHALYYLREHEAATLDELATVVAGWLRAREDEAGVATPEDRERVRAELHHVHLPRLAAAGIVCYDLDSGEVTLRALPAFLDATIERSLATDRERGGRSRDPPGD